MARPDIEVRPVVRQRIAHLGDQGERVSTGLFALRFGAEDLGRPFLATAERLAGMDPAEEGGT
jgi:hypothetical protein